MLTTNLVRADSRRRDSRVHNGHGLEVPRELEASQRQDVRARETQLACRKAGLMLDSGRPIAVHFMTLPDRVIASTSSLGWDHVLTVHAGRATGLLRVHETATCSRHHRGMSRTFVL